MENGAVAAGCDSFKFCEKCQEYKSLVDFYSDRNRAIQRTPSCKDCMGRYADGNRERVRRTVRNWQSRNRGKTRNTALARCKTIKGRFGHLKTQARQRGIAVELTIEQYQSLISSGFCHYMGEPLGPTGSGLDRKDSSGIYSIDNCVPCCIKCNRIRGEDNITYDEMLQVASLLKTIRSRASICS